MKIKISKNNYKQRSNMSGREMPLQLDAPRFRHLLLLLILVFILFLLLLLHRNPMSSTAVTFLHSHSASATATPKTTTLHNILFSIASSSSSFAHRVSYLRLWYHPNLTRALVFLDKLPPQSPPGDDINSSDVDPSLLPPMVTSHGTSKFPYTFRRGHRSAIRVARIVKEVVDRGEADVRWFVFGDDDTIFIPHNLVAVLSNYDHNRWYYIGSRSESLEQNIKMSFDMAYGGGGFAISASLARVLARVLDSCLMRYHYLYGSDSRVYSCVAELGVSVTLEPGFHQLDVRGSVVGLLSAHPVSPVLSLHHMDVVEPVFPGMNRGSALQHLFKAVSVDPARILQQTVCYSESYNMSVSVAWGYVVQVYQGNHLITDLISPFRTFTPWRRNAVNNKRQYLLNTREYPKNPCMRPAFFFFQAVEARQETIWSIYVNKFMYDCYQINNSIRRLRDVRISSSKLEDDNPQQRHNPRRRQCCDIAHPVDTSMFIYVRPCKEEELISMYQ